ncbi:MAG: GMC family oxidoreductase [Gammaproteobacteria bacterium]
MTDDSCDALVIGSGAGGTAAAYRLVLGGLRVALIEKGGHLPTDGSTLDIRRVVHDGEFLSREAWRGGRGQPLTPEEHFNVGGKTKWYGAALLRFGEHEFRPDPAHGCMGWPIAASDLAPYYSEVERLLGVQTFDYEPDLARILARVARPGGDWTAQPMPLGLAPDIAMDRAEASHFDGFASVRGLKGEAEQSLLRRLKASPRFTLITHAEVTQLIGVAGAPASISGVRLGDGRQITAPRVFLAAGALHSPRLLARYLSASGLASQLPMAKHVGRHLKLHLLTAMVSLSSSRKSDLIRKTALLTNDRFPHSSVQPLGFDGELIGTLVPRFVPDFIRREVGRRSYGFFLQTEDSSEAANRVYESEDGVPVMDYDETRMPRAAREHRDFARAFTLALGKAGLVSFTRRVGLNGTAHACGTLRCGHHASDSVVDAQGRVHGMSGLYVVDGSILPRSSSVNPSLSIYAWGLRVGDLVSQQFLREQRWPAEAREVAHANP